MIIICITLYCLIGFPTCLLMIWREDDDHIIGKHWVPTLITWFFYPIMGALWTTAWCFLFTHDLCRNYKRKKTLCRKLDRYYKK